MNEADYLNEARMKSEIEELALRLAVLRAEELDALEFEAAAACGDAQFSPEEMDATAHRQLPLLKKRVSAAARRANRGQFRRKFVPRGLCWVACALLTLYLGSTIALAVSSDARAYFSRLIFHPTPRYTEISMEQSPMASVEVPKEWEGDYFMSYIPEGFELSQAYPDLVEYYNADGGKLDFSENPPSMQTNINTEDAKVDYVKIQGTEAMVVELEGWTTLVWSGTDRYFILSLQGDSDAAIKIANSVVKIDQK